MYHMGDYELMFDPGLAVASLTVALLCSVGVTWLTCRYELMSTAANLIRPKSPKSRQKGMAGAYPVSLEPYELSDKGFRAECFPV